MQNHFVTEFGHRIDFIPGYHERVDRFTSTFRDTHFTQERAGFIDRPATWTAKGTYQKSFLKNYAMFSYVVQFLQRWRLSGPWQRAIDLGGAYGVFSALLKASGLAREVAYVDLLNYAAITPDYQEFLNNLEEIAAAGTVELEKARNMLDFFPGSPSLFGMHRQFPNLAQVDEFQHGDLFHVTEKFDLVTSIATVDLFDLDATLAKVREMMAPNGLFVCLEEYWWWIVNSTCVAGHFPYTVQRLTAADLGRYVEEHHPHLMPSLDARLNYLYGGKRPTMTDWCAAAERQGLRVIAIDRIMPKNHHRVGFKVTSLLKLPDFNLNEILRDIRHYRPDVGVDDLLTSINVLAMVKA